MWKITWVRRFVVRGSLCRIRNTKRWTIGFSFLRSLLDFCFCSSFAIAKDTALNDFPLFLYAKLLSSFSALNCSSHCLEHNLCFRFCYILFDALRSKMGGIECFGFGSAALSLGVVTCTLVSPLCAYILSQIFVFSRWNAVQNEQTVFV